MGSTLNGLMNIAQQSIYNNQVALNVVSNNIANMNTKGYTKQQVEFAAIPGYRIFDWCANNGKVTVGQGAEITGITTKRSEWLDNYYRGQNSANGYYDQIGGMLDNMENLLNDELSSNGLEKRFSDFFAASQALSGDPTNKAYKIAFLNAAQDVADMLNSMSNTVNEYMNQAVGTVGDPDSFESSLIKTNVDSLDSKLSQLAELNNQIAQNPTSNALKDQRDMLLDDISSMIPLTTTTNENGTVNVIIDGQTVIKGGEKRLTIEAVQGDDPNHPVKIQLKDSEGNIKNDDISDKLGNCSLSAILQAGSGDSFGYKTLLNDLDKLASAFAQEMNRIQTQADANGTPMYIGPDGTLVESTTPLFVTKDGTGNFTAGNIQINQAVIDDPTLVATARMDTTAADFDDKAVGNTGNMDQFNNLAKGKLTGLSISDPPGEGMSITDFISGLVSKIGSGVSSLKSAADAQGSVLEQAAAQRDALYGVDLNEELADLIRYQRCYEASARVFSTSNELMQTILQMI
ncbi:MAG: flagellar hook-associated protein FlgK [Clostridium sp.]|jgi:flagellar hook-associated protein flgK|nr:flagellar hook-associated protein FlgK [Clostridium sp.]